MEITYLYTTCLNGSTRNESIYYYYSVIIVDDVAAESGEWSVIWNDRENSRKKEQFHDYFESIQRSAGDGAGSVIMIANQIYVQQEFRLIFFFKAWLCRSLLQVLNQWNLEEQTIMRKS